MNEIKYLFFDLETTGKSVTKDKIVQLAAVLLDSEFRMIDQKNILINPGMPIPAEATAVHGITDEMVTGKPLFKDVAAELINLFSDCVLSGYNIKNYDVPLLSEEFNRVNIAWPPVGITIVDAYKIFSLKERRDLSYAVKFYTGVDLQGAHDAEVDVDATINVFISQMQMYQDLREMTHKELQAFCDEGVKSLDLAGKITLNDQDIPCYSFGKSKGVPVVNDKGFGEWMLRNDFPSDTKNVIKSLIYKNNQ